MGHVVSERIRRADEPILKIMSETAGIRFHSRPGIVHMPENLPDLYAAAWKWRDVSISEFISQAPERLARLTEQIAALTITGAPDGASGLGVSVRITIKPGE